MKDREMFSCKKRCSAILAGTRANGGAIINIITALVFFGLIAFGVWWVIKTTGEAGQQYTDAMINTSHKASALKCQMNMRTIWQNLQMYAISNGSFPASQQELMNWCGNTRLFHCDEPNAPQYVYIPGQTGDMPAANILLFEPEPVHNGRCNVLYLGGQIELITPEELKRAIEATLVRLRQRHR
jgi:prepilin-type processing-associated H-X9-DG protein